MNNTPKISLVVIYRRAEHLSHMVESCLQDIDEAILVDTGPDDQKTIGEEADLARALTLLTGRELPVVCAEYRCPREFTHQGKAYIGDFAMARNFAHSLAGNPWHLTLDSDDTLVKSPGLRLGNLINDVSEEFPNVQAIGADYVYSDEITHPKLRLIRWEKNRARWVGALHEKVELLGRGVQVGPELLKVEHAFGNIEESSERNEELLRRLPPELWTTRIVLAMCGGYALRGDWLSVYRVGLPWLLSDSSDEDTDGLAQIVVDACQKLGAVEQALEVCSMMQPHSEGFFYDERIRQLKGDYQRYVVCSIEGTPYSKIQRFRALEDSKELDQKEGRGLYLSVNDETRITYGQRLRDRLVLCPEPSDRDRELDILCPSPIPWGPSVWGRCPMGGSEQAVLHLAPELARSGPVTVWGSKLQGLGTKDGVTYRNLDAFFPLETNAPIVIWRSPELARVIKERAPHRRMTFWAHDVPRVEQVKDLLCCDTILCLSEYHRELFLSLGIPANKLIRIRNGINLFSIQRAIEHVESRDPHAVIYASSAVRGLGYLLAIWEKVKCAVPEASLHIAYDLAPLSRPGQPYHSRAFVRDLLKRLSFLSQSGDVHFYGGMPHQRLLELEGRCSVWAYPTVFPEISCITAMETAALGVVPLCSSMGALRETAIGGGCIDPEVIMADMDCPSAFDRARLRETGEYWKVQKRIKADDSYSELLIEALKNPFTPEERLKLSTLAMSLYDWKGVASPFREAVEKGR